MCEESKINEAKDSGSELFGSDNLINDITSGKINFDNSQTLEQATDLYIWFNWFIIEYYNYIIYTNIIL